MSTRSFSNVKLYIAWVNKSSSLPEAIVSNENMTDTLGKIDRWFDLSGGLKSEGLKPSTSIYGLSRYAECTTAAATSAKVVQLTSTATTSGSVVSGAFTLERGSRVVVKFTNGITSTSNTLNVDGTGAKNIFYRGAALATTISAGSVFTLIYDGTQWNIVGDIDTAGGISASDGIKIVSNVVKHDVTTSADTTSTVTPTSSAKTFTAITSVTRDSWGHVKTLNTSTVTLPTEAFSDTKNTAGATNNTGTLALIGALSSAIGANPQTYSKQYTFVDGSGNLGTSGDMYVNTSGWNTTSAKKVATETYVDDAIAALPTPMQFKGTVGSGGTIEWSALPAASASNGYTYKVITAHSTDPVCEVGDTIISNGTTWIVVPSGDEPSGTVTSVALSNNSDTSLTISGSPITSSGTLKVSHTDSVTAVTTATFYKVKYNATGHITGTTAVAKADITALGIPAEDTTYTLSGAYGTSSKTWVTTLTPSSGTATTSTVPTASTSVYGITKLSSSTSSTSTTLAATASAVKAAYDLAGTKSIVSVSQTQTSGVEIGKVTVDGTATTLYAPPDTKVTQSSGTGYRFLLLSAQTDSSGVPTSVTSTTDQAYASTKIAVNASNGNLYSGGAHYLKRNGESTLNALYSVAYDDDTNTQAMIAHAAGGKLMLGSVTSYGYKHVGGPVMLSTGYTATSASDTTNIYKSVQIVIPKNSDTPSGSSDVESYDVLHTGNTNPFTHDDSSTVAKDVRYTIPNKPTSAEAVATNYLDATGGWTNPNSNIVNAANGFGIAACSTAAATADKVATCTNYVLKTGGIVSVRFTYNVPASATLNINSQGAKSIYWENKVIVAGVIQAGDLATFIYNGSVYQLIALDHANTGDTLELYCVAD